MTVSSTNRKAGPYYGNGVSAAFPFSFKVFAASDLLVVRTNLTTGVDTTLAATDYSVSLTADTTGGYSGGTVTLSAGALASGYTLTITSSILYTQNADLTNTGGFYPKVINSALDRLTILCQQLLEQVSRSLKLSISTPTNVKPTLPAPVKNNMIAWNADADGLQNLDPQALATIVAFGTANSDKFSGDGTTTQFALSNNPGALNNLDVSIGGVTQRPGIDYNWSAGTVITFTTAPAVGTNNILVRYMQGLPQGYTTSDLVQYGSSNVKDALDAINLAGYAALQSYTGNAKSVYVTGYLVSAAPSGIAGDFVRDDSDTTSVSDGATIFRDGLNRCWKRQFKSFVFPEWWGADPNGITLSTTAVQSAINLACTKGYSVKISAGARFRVGDLTIPNTSGCNIVGDRSGHQNGKGSLLIYTGTGNCISIADGSANFMYRAFLKDFTIFFEQNCNSGIYGKNLQECLIENVGVWADTHTVQYAMDLDGIGIINVDNCISSRCVNGIKMHYDTPPNPQANGGSSITRCNIYYATNSIILGYTLGIDIRDNWIEGFQNAILVVNSGDVPRAEIADVHITNNYFIQSTTGLTETRALKIASTDDTHPIRFYGTFSKNFCYMNSSGATTPSYAISIDAASNSSVIDVRLVYAENEIVGVSQAGLYNNTQSSNSQKCLVIDKGDNIVTDALFSAVRLQTVKGQGITLGQIMVLNNTVSALSAPASTTESLVKQVNIPAYLLGNNGRLRITALWSATNNANTKLVRIRMSDLSGTIISQVDMGGATFSTVVCNLNNRGSTNSQYTDSYAINSSGLSGAGWRAAPAYDTTNMVPLLLTVQKGSSSDSVVLESLLVEVVLN